jgi:hypothetical protein
MASLQNLTNNSRVTMGRRKKKERALHREWRSKQARVPDSHPIASTPIKARPSIIKRSEDFDALVEMAGYTLPNQLRNWQRFFMSRERYLDAAEEWLEARLAGCVWPKIEDDVDKGLIKQGSSSTYNAGWSWSQWDGYEDEYAMAYGGPQKPSSPWWKRLVGYYNPPLPMEHKLPAPAGISGCNMATVF